MKKNYFMALALAAVTSSVQAQSDGDWGTYDFKDFELVDDYGEGVTNVYYPIGAVNHVSGNGEYAVGYDVQKLISNTGGAYLWKRSEPHKLFQLGILQNRTSACDVSNNGIVVGTFENRTDQETQVVAYPGWRHVDGAQWNQLPVPAEYSTYFAKSSDLSEEARAITPDGKYIAGGFHYKTGEKEVFGQVVDVAIFPVAVWEKSGDSYELKNCYTELGKAGNNMRYVDGELKTMDKDVSYKTFLVRDISNDGRTIVGMNVSWRGGFNPAFVRDGKLVQLFNCGEEGESEDEANFNGGVIRSIDANGNMYGYYANRDNEECYFVYTADGKLEITEEEYVCADKAGNRMTATINGMELVTDCSEDGSVIAGAEVASLGYMMYHYPKLLVSNKSTGIGSAKVNVDNVTIDNNGGKVTVKGDCLYTNVYDTAGKVVDGGGRGKVFDLNGLPAGTYILKVATLNGIKTFKVAK